MHQVVSITNSLGLRQLKPEGAFVGGGDEEAQNNTRKEEDVRLEAASGTVGGVHQHATWHSCSISLKMPKQALPRHPPNVVAPQSQLAQLQLAVALEGQGQLQQSLHAATQTMDTQPTQKIGIRSGPHKYLMTNTKGASVGIKPPS